MTDKEILAELKRCYEYLVDIRDNADETQLSKADKNILMTAMNCLEKNYEQVYEKIKNENDIELYYEENLLIASEIYHDYYTNYKDGEDMYVTSADLGEKEWWNDKVFIYEM